MSDGIRLSVSDVARLLTNPSPENRAETVATVGREFARGSLNDEARSLAKEIFRIVVHDAEVLVRKALADCIKDNPQVPHDIALTLAHDVAEVAIPVVERSEILDEGDLMDIVRNFDAKHQAAVARRSHLSADVSGALAETHDEEVVATLVANEGAEISEETLSSVLDEFGDNEKVNAPLVHRENLPVTIAERLVTLVSQSLRDHIVAHHEISPDLASDLILESRERATVSLLDPGGETTDVLDLVDQLHRHGRLTPTLILRALCMGDGRFFEASLAKRAEIPLPNAIKLIEDEGGLGLPSLFEKAKIPGEMAALSRVALRVMSETEYDGGENDRARFRARMIERVLTTLESDIDPENLDYFISKLGQGPLQAVAS